MASRKAARKGSNVSSHFTSTLNALPSGTNDKAQTNESLDLDSDLSLFLNTEFNFLEDFGDPLGPPLDPQLTGTQSPLPHAPSSVFDAPGRQPQQSGHGGTSDAATTVTTLHPRDDIKNLNFEDDFPFNSLPYLQTTDPALQNAGPHNYASQSQDFDLNFASPTSPYGFQGDSSVTPSPPNGKRNAPNDPAALEVNSRAAAEEDKRRRNTAASARFRVKKKQREQALEKTAKEMTDKVGQLEQRVGELEKENKWLRGLVVEKTAKGGDEVAELWKQFKEEDRSNESEKKGVGTTEA